MTTDTNTERRKARTDGKRRDAAYAQARLVAAANAYRLHEKLAEMRAGTCDALPRGWRGYRPRLTSGSVRLLPAEAGRGQQALYMVPCGTVTYEHSGYLVEWALDDGSGWPMAVVLRDTYQDTRSLLAIGAEGDQMAFLPLTLSPDEWQRVLGGSLD